MDCGRRLPGKNTDFPFESEKMDLLFASSPAIASDKPFPFHISYILIRSGKRGYYRFGSLYLDLRQMRFYAGLDLLNPIFWNIGQNQ